MRPSNDTTAELEYLCVGAFMKSLVDAQALSSAFELGMIDCIVQSPLVVFDDLKSTVGTDERALRLLVNLLIVRLAEKDAECVACRPIDQVSCLKDLDSCGHVLC